HADAKYHSAFLGRGKKLIAVVFHQVEIEPMEPKILRIRVFRTAKGNARPRGKSAKPFLKILTHAVTDYPQAGFRRLEQTEKTLLRLPLFPSNLWVLVV